MAYGKKEGGKGGGMLSEKGVTECMKITESEADLAMKNTGTKPKGITETPKGRVVADDSV